jgi:SPP1 gp7 family putative phage head morphogenesis protein
MCVGVDKRETKAQQPVPAAGLPESYPAYLKPIPITEGRDAKALLDAVLAREAQWDGTHVPDAPALIRFLYSTWTACADPLKYQEIRNSLLRGEISEQWLATWQQAYSAYITQVVAPKWQEGIRTGARLVEDGLRTSEIAPSWRFTPTGARTAEWIQTRGAQLVVQITDTQRQALQSVLEQYVVNQPVTPAQVAQVIRPIIGLTPGEADAVAAYRIELAGQIAQGEVTADRAEWLVQNYAARLHRMRATRIAVTEMSFAVNRGQQIAMEDARDDGWFGDHPVKKKWLTGEDERVCARCGPLDGKIIDAFDADFPGGTTAEPTVPAPPLHPNCRCTLGYALLMEES